MRSLVLVLLLAVSCHASVPAPHPFEEMAGAMRNPQLMNFASDMFDSTASMLYRIAEQVSAKLPEESGQALVRDTIRTLSVHRAQLTQSLNAAHSTSGSGMSTQSLSTQCANAFTDANSYMSACKTQYNALWSASASDLQDNKLPAYCSGSPSCADRAATAYSWIAYNCTSDSQDSFSSSWKLLGAMIRLPCAKDPADSSRYCLPDFRSLSTIGQSGINEGNIGTFCSRCIREVIVPQFQAFGQMSEKLLLLGLQFACAKDGDTWCYLYFQEISKNQNPTVAMYCANRCLKIYYSILSLTDFIKVNETLGKAFFGELMETYCLKDGSTYCIDRMATSLQGNNIGQVCPSMISIGADDSLPACSGACAAAVSGVSSALGCCTQALFSFFSLFQEARVQRLNEFFTNQCNKAPPAKCEAGGTLRITLGMAGLSSSYCSANPDTCRQSVCVSLAQVLIFPPAKCTVTGTQSASSVAGQFGVLAADTTMTFSAQVKSASNDDLVSINRDVNTLYKSNTLALPAVTALPLTARTDAATSPSVASMTTSCDGCTSSGLSAGAVAGIVIGVLAAVGLIVAGSVFYYKRRRSPKPSASSAALETEGVRLD